MCLLAVGATLLLVVSTNHIRRLLGFIEAIVRMTSEANSSSGIAVKSLLDRTLGILEGCVDRVSELHLSTSQNIPEIDSAVAILLLGADPRASKQALYVQCSVRPEPVYTYAMIRLLRTGFVPAAFKNSEQHSSRFGHLLHGIAHAQRNSLGVWGTETVPEDSDCKAATHPSLGLMQSVAQLREIPAVAQYLSELRDRASGVSLAHSNYNPENYRKCVGVSSPKHELQQLLLPGLRNPLLKEWLQYLNNGIPSAPSVAAAILIIETNINTESCERENLRRDLAFIIMEFRNTDIVRSPTFMLHAAASVGDIDTFATLLTHTERGIMQHRDQNLRCESQVLLKLATTTAAYCGHSMFVNMLLRVADNRMAPLVAAMQRGVLDCPIFFRKCFWGISNLPDAEKSARSLATNSAFSGWVSTNLQSTEGDSPISRLWGLLGELVKQDRRALQHLLEVSICNWHEYEPLEVYRHMSDISLVVLADLERGATGNFARLMNCLADEETQAQMKNIDIPYWMLVGLHETMLKKWQFGFVCAAYESGQHACLQTVKAHMPEAFDQSTFESVVEHLSPEAILTASRDAAAIMVAALEMDLNAAPVRTIEGVQLAVLSTMIRIQATKLYHRMNSVRRERCINRLLSAMRKHGKLLQVSDDPSVERIALLSLAGIDIFKVWTWEDLRHHLHLFNVNTFAKLHCNCKPQDDLTRFNQRACKNFCVVAELVATLQRHIQLTQGEFQTMLSGKPVARIMQLMTCTENISDLTRAFYTPTVINLQTIILRHTICQNRVTPCPSIIDRLLVPNRTPPAIYREIIEHLVRDHTSYLWAYLKDFNTDVEVDIRSPVPRGLKLHTIRAPSDEIVYLLSRARHPNWWRINRYTNMQLTMLAQLGIRNPETRFRYSRRWRKLLQGVEELENCVTPDLSNIVLGYLTGV
jgi:hypothetical protein